MAEPNRHSTTNSLTRSRTRRGSLPLSHQSSLKRRGRFLRLRLPLLLFLRQLLRLLLRLLRRLIRTECGQRQRGPLPPILPSLSPSPLPFSEGHRRQQSKAVPMSA